MCLKKHRREHSTRAYIKAFFWMEIDCSDKSEWACGKEHQ